MIKRFWYSLLYFSVYRIYAPVHDWIVRIKRRGIYYGSAPCQICGQQGHEEGLCPQAEEMGF
jgi:hypothetical protein